MNSDEPRADSSDERASILARAPGAMERIVTTRQTGAAHRDTTSNAKFIAQSHLDADAFIYSFIKNGLGIER